MNQSKKAYFDIFDEENINQLLRQNYKYRIIQNGDNKFYAQYFKSETRESFEPRFGVSLFFGYKNKLTTYYYWEYIGRGKNPSNYALGSYALGSPPKHYETYDEALKAIEDYKKYPIITEIK